MSTDNPYEPRFNQPEDSFSPPVSNVQVRNMVPEFADIFRHAWDTWKNNLALVVGASLVVFGISIAISIVAGPLELVLQDNGRSTVASNTVAVIFNIVNNILQIFLGIGEVRLMCALLRGQPGQISMLFSGGDRFWATLGVSVLFSLMLLGGFLLLIVPGVIILFKFWPCYYLVVDRSVPVMKSFGLASETTRGNSLNTFLIGLCSMGIGLLGLLACVVGIVFAQPLVMLLVCCGYLMMSGQLIARPESELLEPPVMN
jgi:uncharacterized membrane protein